MTWRQKAARQGWSAARVAALEDEIAKRGGDIDVELSARGKVTLVYRLRLEVRGQVVIIEQRRAWKPAPDVASRVGGTVDTTPWCPVHGRACDPRDGRCGRRELARRVRCSCLGETHYGSCLFAGNALRTDTPRRANATSAPAVTVSKPAKIAPKRGRPKGPNPNQLRLFDR